jgi:hypothetical protein
VNVFIYLSAYNLEVYHLVGRLNLVLDALSRLPAKGDEATHTKADMPTLDDLWDNNNLTADSQVLFIAKAQMDKYLRSRFSKAYIDDTIYGNIVKDLATPPSSSRKPAVTMDNEVVVNVSKPGYPFRLVDGLLYNRDSVGRERLVIPKPLVKDIL